MRRCHSGILAPALLVLLSAPVAPAAPVAGAWRLPSSAQCAPGETPQPISLDRAWTEARAHEPGYRAAAEGVAAESALARSVTRQWIPSFSVEALGNQGQRLSPSEERNLGVGPRGELRLLGNWTLLDSDRSRGAEVADRRIVQALAEEERFDLTFRAAAARMYVAAAASEERYEASQDHVDRLRELSEPIRLRVEAGLDLAWEDQLVREAMARAERLLIDAELDRDAARRQLSGLVGECARATAFQPRLPDEAYREGLDRSPHLTSLRSQAETLSALAREEADRGRWQLSLIGAVGPNHSRALEDGNVRNEYLVGVAATWRPDLAGVRRQLAASEASRARAVLAESESLQRAFEREVARLDALLERAEVRQAGLLSEVEQARLRQEAAVLRWLEGVDRWTEVVQARERVLETRILEIEHRLEVADALIGLGEVTGQLTRLPEFLVHEEDR